MQKLLFSVVVCAAFASGALASASPLDEATTSAVAPTPKFDPVIAKAKEDNGTILFLTLHQLAYQEIFTYMFAAGKTEELSALLATCCKLHTQLLHEGVHAAFRQVLKKHPNVKMLNHWQGGLFCKGSKVQHLIWARQTLASKNLNKWENEEGTGLLRQLTEMPHKDRALALAAYAEHLSMDKLCRYERELIIEATRQPSRSLSEYGQRGAACQRFFMQGIHEGYIVSITIAGMHSPRPLSEFEQLGAVCKVLFTEKMDAFDWQKLIKNAFASPLSLSEFEQRGVACKPLLRPEIEGYHPSGIIIEAINSSQPLSQIMQVVATCPSLFTKEMSGDDQGWMIRAVLPLPHIQVEILVEECKVRTEDDGPKRLKFIRDRARAMLTKQE